MVKNTTNFESMYLISENYLNTLKNNQDKKEEEIVKDNINTELATNPTPQTPITSTPPLPPQSPSPSPSPSPTPLSLTPTTPKPTPTPTNDTSLIEELSPNEEEQETKSAEVSSKKDTANTEDNTKLEVKIKNGQYETVTDKLESFNCPVCKEAFKTKKDMLKHEKVNHTEHECKTCDLLFKNAAELNAHITQEHVINEALRHTRSRNKRKLMQEDEQNQNSKKKIKVQPKIDSIKDVNIKKRKQINDLMEETNKKRNIEPTTYTKGDRKRKREEDLSMDKKRKLEPTTYTKGDRKRKREEDLSMDKKRKLEHTTYTKNDRKRKREEDLSMGNEDNRRIKHTMNCSICGKEFESLYEYQDHRH